MRSLGNPDWTWTSTCCLAGGAPGQRRPLVALALPVAASEPAQKDLMVKPMEDSVLLKENGR